MESINPTTNTLIQRYEPHSDQALHKALHQSHDAFKQWRKTSIPNRSEALWRLAKLLRDNADQYAQMITREMGKPINQSQAEIEKCAWVTEYYAKLGPSMLAQQVIQTEAEKSYISFQPLGVILAIMPWNFPFWQVFRFAVPTMLAGNTVILKHAANVCGCSLLIEEIFKQAGFPEQVFTSILAEPQQLQPLIADDIIKAVTLTGSTQAGKSVAQTAGASLKKCVLELGGSDPYVILEDASIEKAVASCVTSRLINTGQSCIAAKRFIVVKTRHNEFVDLIQQQFAKQVIGDPMDSHTTIGPMARSDLRDQLHQQVLASIDLGATCVIGGECLDQPGAYYPPTLLTNITPNMPAYHDELFGPVAAVICADNTEHAIEMANDSPFGLGAAIFSENRQQAEQIAVDQLEAGSVFVNDFVKSDPRLPFGGIKQSGYGRELGSFGIHEFVNIKTISLSS